MVGMLDQMISNAIETVQKEFNGKHQELMTRIGSIDKKLANIEAALQRLEARK